MKILILFAAFGLASSTLQAASGPLSGPLSGADSVSPERFFNCVNGQLGQALLIDLQESAVSTRITDRVTNQQTFNRGTLTADDGVTLTYSLENPAQVLKIAKSSLATDHGKASIQLDNNWFRCNKQ